MPITRNGWELHIERVREDARGSNRRTVGKYQVYHSGTAVPRLFGTCVETRGPGDNSEEGNKRRIEEGRYPLRTQDGTTYVTIGYEGTPKKPGLELGDTGNRTEILIHPGNAFMATVGCINPSARLVRASDNIDYADSRARVIAIIEDLKQFAGRHFPTRNGRPIPNAWVVVDGEP